MGMITSIIMTIASMVMQYVQMRQQRARQAKAAKEAKVRADMAKGFVIPVDGEAVALSVAYGRNLLGGVRVYHATSGTVACHQYAAPAVGGTWFGNGTLRSTVCGIVRRKKDGYPPSEVGRKNEFLYVQQALTTAGISRVVNIDVDSVDHLDSKLSYGQIHHVYPKGGVADPMMVANKVERATALFTGVAYATSVFRINRDDPQYNGVPSTQFYIEGMEISTILGSKGARYLSTTKTYSNNPVLCLLDYLTNPTYGRGLSAEEIDLDTFYSAYVLCERVVKTDAPIEGQFWKGVLAENTKLGIPTRRNIKLFECNVALDTEATLRDNIETILETMGLAELIWSGGQYKLSMYYPTIYQPATPYNIDDVVEYSYTDGSGGQNVDLYRCIINGNTNVPTSTGWVKDVISAYITDDDIDRNYEVTSSWPDAQSRYNHATIKFLNEARNFKEDSVTWPSKYGIVNGENKDRGAWSGAELYNASDLVTYSGAKYQLVLGFNRQSAVAPNGDTAWQLYDSNLVYSQYLREDNNLPLELDFFESGTTDYYHAMAKAEQRVRSSRANTVYTLNLSITHSDLEPGDLIKINSEVLGIPGEIIRIEEAKVDAKGANIQISGVVFDARVLAWNAADDQIVVPRAIYDNAIEQANSLVFNQTSSAMSMVAGELTWTSAQDIRVVQYYVMYTTDTINTINVDTEWTELGRTTNPRFDVPPLIGGQYVLAVAAATSSGAMAPQWDTVTGSRWPMISTDLTTVNIDSTTLLNVSIYTRSSVVPNTPTGGVFDFDVLGLTSTPNGWASIIPNGNDALYISQAIAETTNGTGVDNTLQWTTPVVFIDTTNTVDLSKSILPVLQDSNNVNYGFTQASGRVICKAGSVDVSTSALTSFEVLSQSFCTISLNNTSGDTNKGLYQVTSLTGDFATAVIRTTFKGVQYDRTLTVVALKSGYSRDLTPPPTPFGATVTTGLNSVFVNFSPNPFFTQGHGYAKTRVYGAVGTSPTFAEATQLATFTGSSGTLQSPRGTLLKLWFKWESIDGVLSDVPLGNGATGISATGGYIDGVDLNPLLDLATYLKDGSITGPKLAAESIAVGTLAVQAGAIINAMIGDLAVDTAKIADLAVDSAKVSDLSSTGYTPTVAGWTINKNGTAELLNVLVRGNVEANNGYFKGDITGSRGVFGGSLEAGVIDLSLANGITRPFETPGTYTVTVPAGKTQMRVRLRGGGGGGAGTGYYDNNQYNNGGGGGGSAGTVIYTLNVVAGTTYTITVGAGGNGNLSIGTGEASNGSDGGDTFIHGLAASGAISYGGKGGRRGNGQYEGYGGAAGTFGLAGNSATHAITTTGGTTNSPTWSTAYSVGGLRQSSASPSGGGGVSYGGAGGQGVYDGFPVRNTNIALCYGERGGNGSAIVEFINPNQVVLAVEYQKLRNACAIAGITYI